MKTNRSFPGGSVPPPAALGHILAATGRTEPTHQLPLRDKITESCPRYYHTCDKRPSTDFLYSFIENKDQSASLCPQEVYNLRRKRYWTKNSHKVIQSLDSTRQSELSFQ